MDDAGVYRCHPFPHLVEDGYRKRRPLMVFFFLLIRLQNMFVFWYILYVIITKSKG
jgi:hypothetical protein